MQKIAIIGHGYVGRAMEEFFKDSFEIVIYDPAQGYADREAVNRADLAVIAVPTPAGPDGRADTRAVEETLEWLRTESIVLKSTVPPGTTARLAERFMLRDRLVFSPEYIVENRQPVPWWEGLPHPRDMKMSGIYIFGGTKEAVAKARPFFTAVGGAHGRYIATDSTTAELAKYFSNAWIATKITFANEAFDIARAFGLDYADVRELWLTDTRVGRSHTLVHPDKRGFDGKCIPKDTAALYTAARDAGHEASLLRHVLKQNARLRGDPDPFGGVGPS